MIKLAHASLIIGQQIDIGFLELLTKKTHISLIPPNRGFSSRPFPLAACAIITA